MRVFDDELSPNESDRLEALCGTDVDCRRILHNEAAALVFGEWGGRRRGVHTVSRFYRLS